MTTLHTYLDPERQADLAKDRSNQAQPAVIWLRDLPRALGRSTQTVRVWRQKGLIPPPDMSPTRKSQGWRRSTLEAAGLVVA
jgi:hypothetical protein